MLRRGPLPEKTENEKGSKDHLEIAPCRSTKDFLLDTDCYDVNTFLIPFRFREKDTKSNNVLLLFFVSSTLHKPVHKALDLLLGWIQWLILTLLPILDQNHKVSVLKRAKDPLQICFKYYQPFLKFLVNFWPKTLFI